MIPEDLMRKYKYGYVHSCEMLNEPFVKDLIKENQELKNQLEEKENQQKEFIEYLESKIDTIIQQKETFAELEAGQAVSLMTLAIALDKYKEIIGDK